MSADPIEFGFVAALEREVSGIVRGWSTTDAQCGDSTRRIYRHGNAAVICAGTGVAKANAAAKVLIEKYSPRMLLSIGFAGSCAPDLHPGSLVVPESLLEAETGKTFRCSFGSGRLVTLNQVAGKALKQEASAHFAVSAVDMEATGVAQAAAESGTEFAAIKVISDGAEEDLGFLSSFVTPDGFETGRFIAYIVVRPALWLRVVALSRNSKLATRALESAVAECMKDGRVYLAKHSPVTQVR